MNTCDPNAPIPGSEPLHLAAEYWSLLPPGFFFPYPDLFPMPLIPN